jgi:hypothetical protein
MTVLVDAGAGAGEACVLQLGVLMYNKIKQIIENSIFQFKVCHSHSLRYSFALLSSLENSNASSVVSPVVAWLFLSG